MGTFDIHIGQRMSNISATLSSFWRSFYGVLTQENFTRCVGASLTLYAIAKSEFPRSGSYISNQVSVTKLRTVVTLNSW